MKKNRVSGITRILLAVCGLGLLIVLFVPMWRIELAAPQYPEGLMMFIYANKLGGNVDIINGLNHYIGMKTLHANDFAEFKILPGLIVFYALLFMAAAVIAKKKWLNLSAILFVLFGIVAMVDFWRWEYDYGHNLNPDAAIIVPGMAYQPPLIGFKQLLNFGAYSIPDIGGWIFVGVGVILLGLVVYEWKWHSKTAVRLAPSMMALLPILSVSLSSCSTQPQALRIGKDNCAFCKMPISDNRFGAEIITKKSKVYTFDDPHCILSFLKASTVAKMDIAGIYYTNFAEPHQLIDASKAYFFKSPDLKSPMNGNVATFDSEDNLNKVLPQFNSTKISREEMQ